MAGTQDDPDINSDHNVEKKCSYCKRPVIEDTLIKCLKCEKVCHESCTSRSKNFKLITAEVGLCCYDNNTTQDLMFITTIIIQNQAKSIEIKLLKILNEELTEKNQLLRKKIEAKQPHKELNYASVTAMSNMNSIQKSEKTQSIIIKPKNLENNEDARSKLTSLINPKQIKFGI